MNFPYLIAGNRVGCDGISYDTFQGLWTMSAVLVTVRLELASFESRRNHSPRLGSSRPGRRKEDHVSEKHKAVLILEKLPGVENDLNGLWPGEHG